LERSAAYVLVKVVLPRLAPLACGSSTLTADIYGRRYFSFRRSAEKKKFVFL